MFPFQTGLSLKEIQPLKKGLTLKKFSLIKSSKEIILSLDKKFLKLSKLIGEKFGLPEKKYFEVFSCLHELNSNIYKYATTNTSFTFEIYYSVKDKKLLIISNNDSSEVYVKRYIDIVTKLETRPLDDFFLEITSSNYKDKQFSGLGFYSIKQSGFKIGYSVKELDSSFLCQTVVFKEFL